MVNLATASGNEETEVHETATRQAAGIGTRMTLGATMKRQRSNLFFLHTCLLSCLLKEIPPFRYDAQLCYYVM